MSGKIKTAKRKQKATTSYSIAVQQTPPIGYTMILPCCSYLKRFFFRRYHFLWIRFSVLTFLFYSLKRFVYCFEFRHLSRKK